MKQDGPEASEDSEILETTEVSKRKNNNPPPLLIQFNENAKPPSPREPSPRNPLSSSRGLQSSPRNPQSPRGGLQPSPRKPQSPRVDLQSSPRNTGEYGLPKGLSASNPTELFGGNMQLDTIFVGGCAEDYLLPTEKGYETGICELYRLAANSQYYPESFIEVIHRFENAFTREHFIAIPNTEIKYYKGRNILYFLANAAANHSPQPLMEVLKRYNRIFTLEDFITEMRGINVLLLLADAVLDGHDAPLLEVKTQYFFESKHWSEVNKEGHMSPLMRLAAAVLCQHIECKQPDVFSMIVMDGYDFKANVFTLPIQKGENEGRNIVWFLSAGAVINKIKPLEVVWKQYKSSFILKYFLIQAQQGEDAGKDPIWLLTKALVNGHTTLIVEVLEYFKDALQVADLRVAALKGEDKGATTLFLLAKALAKGNEAAFTKAFLYAKGEFTAEDFLLSCQGHTVLSFLIKADCKNLSTALFDVLSRIAFDRDILLEIAKQCSLKVAQLIKEKLLTGNSAFDKMSVLFSNFSISESVLEKRKSASYSMNTLQNKLWWVAHDDFENGSHFMRQELNNKSLNISDFLVKSQQEEHKGKNAFWYMMARGHVDTVLTFWSKYKKSCKALYFKTHAEAGIDKGKNILFLLINCVNINMTAPLQQMLMEVLALCYENGSEYFTQKILSGPDRNKDALWSLVVTAMEGYANPFLMVVRAYYKAGFDVKDFTLPIPNGWDQGRNLIWLLVATAANGDPEPLMEIWSQYKARFKAKDFCAIALQGADRGVNTICLLAEAMFYNPEHIPLLIEILTHIIGNLRASDFSLRAQGTYETGKSALWWLATICSKYPEGFMLVLKECENEFKVEDFLAPVLQEGEDQHTYVLWILCAVVKHNDAPLLELLRQYQGAFKEASFILKIPVYGEWLSPLDLLVQAAVLCNKPAALLAVLSQVQFDEVTLKMLHEEDLPEEVAAYIGKKNSPKSRAKIQNEDMNIEHNEPLTFSRTLPRRRPIKENEKKEDDKKKKQSNKKYTI